MNHLLTLARVSGSCIGLALLLVSLLGTGCKHGNAINFVTSTQFGLKVGVNAEKIPEVQIGYNRQEAARVPVYLEKQGGTNGSDNLPAAPVSVSSILAQAKMALQKGTAADDIVAAGLIASAVKMGQSGDGESILVVISEKAKESPLDAAKRGVLQGLIEAEIQKPAAMSAFYEKAKYVGKRNGPWAEDAYSVLGTFSGAGTASASGGTNGNLTIAQYFATGVAAQILAEKGGAAVVNPNAKPASDSGDPKAAFEAGKKQGEKQRDVLERAAKFILDQGTDGAAQRKERAKKALAGIEIEGESLDDVASRISTKTSESDIRKLLMRFREDSAIIEKNLPAT